MLSRANKCLLVRWSLTFLTAAPGEGGGGGLGLRVGFCSNAPPYVPLVEFTQGDTPSYNAYCILEMQGSQCTSSTKSNFVSGTCFDLSRGGYFYSTQPYTCNDATCCLAIFCDNSVFSCSNLSYETTFAGTLSDGVVAGSEFSRRFLRSASPSTLLSLTFPQL